MTKPREKTREELTAEIEDGKKKIRQLENWEKVLRQKLSIVNNSTHFDISKSTLSYITQSNSGEGLLFYGSVTIPFVDRFPRGEIYDLLTTKPEDAANGKQAE